MHRNYLPSLAPTTSMYIFKINPNDFDVLDNRAHQAQRNWWCWKEAEPSILYGVEKGGKVSRCRGGGDVGIKETWKPSPSQTSREQERGLGCCGERGK